MQEIDIAKIEPVLREYKDKKESLVPILQKVQEIYGYLPKPALQEVSKQTKIPLSKIYGVATFYAQFYLAQRGKNIIRVCCGTACHVKGGGEIKESVGKLLNIKEGETTSDYKFTLETVGCVGTCFLAPVMVINQTYYGRLTSKKAENIIKSIEK